MNQQDIATFRAIEGSLELQFCDDEGEINATYSAQRTHLVTEGFTESEIDMYLSQYEWDAEGVCIGEKSLS
jgi:hypothetical protein